MPSRTTVALPALQRLRVKSALTQQQLADLAQLHRVTVAELEGGRPANMGTVQALAKALKCRPADLMGDS
jgi:transcriptional regulator with XRE-family HTH domain